MGAYLTYFLSKEENEKLSEETKKMCHECWVKSKRQNLKGGDNK